MAGLENHYKEWFSRSFLQAASASAGIAMQLIQDDLFGVDAILKDGYTSVDVQLKATASPQFDGNGDILFDLDVPTYDLLRAAYRDNSAYLVLAVLDPERSRWVTQDKGGTHLHDHAYWLRLTGMPSTPNESTIRLRIPVRQRLSPESVRLIVESERKVLVT